MALATTLALCVRSQDLVMSLSVRRVHVVLSTATFKGGFTCLTTRHAAERHPEDPTHLAGFEPNPLVH